VWMLDGPSVARWWCLQALKAMEAARQGRKYLKSPGGHYSSDGEQHHHHHACKEHRSDLFSAASEKSVQRGATAQSPLKMGADARVACPCPQA
jgi:hypothetical protein